ncbi:MAG: methylmalonyl Co-A mutase-associated GTPase MeaB, partial [Candidatus Competibacteraceae bacterium]|nr:methylmalonyl Co-A mutase-associated GTPase MeaB [Candidatus Competibacteraceae bacterium]
KLCSALEQQGISEAWQSVIDYRDTLDAAGEFSRQRQTQAKSWLQQELREGLWQAFAGHAAVREQLPQLEQAVATGAASAPVAAKALLARFLDST